MNVLVIDIGGTNVKILATGQKEPRKFPSGPSLSPRQMVDGVKKLAATWKYDVVSIGYPGVVVKDRILTEPHNLASGWVGFNFKAAFRCPVKIINDAAMQALGSYRKGQMLFLGLGTGLGSAMVVEGVVVPMELGHLSYRNGTYEDYVGLRGLKRLGKKKWRKHVTFVVNRLISALRLDDVVLGGGNAMKLQKLPSGCRLGTNANAFIGGFRMWEAGKTKQAGGRRPRPRAKALWQNRTKVQYPTEGTAN
ncbi:MAG TPA: ROK family protein [Terriglobales bacterium]|nr:ROK family protein [Terriglobales bacterium]